MKIFHLSDLHIGLKLFQRDLREDQEYIFQQIIRRAEEEQPDVLLIAGDLYDRAVPSAESAEVFDHLISGLTAALPRLEIMLISGNHDSAARLNVYRSVLEHQHLHVIGLPPQLPEDHIACVTLEDAFGPVHFWLLPFVKPSMVKLIVGSDENGNNLSYEESVRRLLAREPIDRSQRNVLVSHQFYLPVGSDPEQIARMDSELPTVGNIDAIRADVLEPFDYAALGHIHKPMQVGSDRYRYCGTPLACSVSEAGQQKGIIEVELGEKGDVQTRVLPLEPLRQVKVLRGTLEEVLAQACGDYVTVVLTNRVEMDALDLQDRLRCAFPCLLEVRRENLRTVTHQAADLGQALDTFALCREFLADLDEEEQALLRDVINTVQEVEA